jgi:mRNA interferase HicA
MKRNALLKHLRRYGCYLKREGRSHSLWCNPNTGHVEAVPRHTDFEFVFVGNYRESILFRIALIVSGVVPQQPPTIDTPASIRSNTL